MYSESQRGVAGPVSRWALAVLTLAAGFLGAGRAWADIQVHVMNCTSDSIYAQAFDAKDAAKLVAASSKKFPSSQSGESASLHCAGEGKGYCEMTIQIMDTPAACGTNNEVNISFKLDSGKWAVVTGFTTEKDDDGTKICKPLVSQNLDSAPSSCN